MKIDREMDKLMWLIAEEGSQSAIADFESRFPQFKYELSKRTVALRNLRAAKPSAAASSIPQFSARHVAGPRINRWAFGAGALVLASIAFGTYALMRPKAPALPVKGPEVGIRVQPLTHPGVNPNRSIRPEQVEDRTEPSSTNNGETRPINTAPILYSIHINQAPLNTVLQAVAAQANCQVEIAPGLTNQTIDAHFDQMSLKDMFETLGARCGFTALQNGERKFLIVPARAKTRDDQAGGDPEGESTGNSG